ncbi:MAG TPA: hypothetical protein VJN44_04750 [Roseateles sp.]|nr:hypothetical protein [Roseateles sp.]
MDPATLAAGVLSALAPYLAKAAGKFAEGAGEAALDLGGKLFDKLKARFAGSPAEVRQLQDLQAAPQDQLNQMALQKLLRDTLAQDPGFARELATLLAQDAGTAAAARFNVQAAQIDQVLQIGQVGTLNLEPPARKP